MAETALSTISRRAGEFIEKARAVVKIRTQEERALVATLLTTNKELQKQIHDDLDPQIENAHKTHADLCALRAKHLDPLLREEVRYKAMQNADNMEQERLRKEKQAKLDAAAKEKAEAERKREVQALKKAGDKEGAEALLQAPVTYTAPQAVNKAAAVAAASGQTFKTTVHFEVTDLSKVDRKYLVLAEQVVMAAARALWKEAEARNGDPVTWSTDAIEGIRVWTTKDSAMAGGRRGPV